MATLEGQTIAGSYKDLLQVSNSNAGVDATARAVSDGEGTATLLYLSTTEVYSPGKAGTSNTVFGKSAGASLDAGSNYNVFIGHEVSDATMNDATYNTAVGYQALSALTTGDLNVVIGALAGDAISTGNNNTIIGTAAGTVTVDVDSTVMIGQSACGDGNMDSDADGTIAIGYTALQALTSGAGNIAIGYQALDAVTTGSQNIAIGYQAADSVLAAYSSNIGIGSNSLGGSHAGTASIRNVAVGEDTLAGAMNDSDNNVAIGWTALTALTLGDQNVVIGAAAGDSLTSGSGNVAIGAASMGSSTDVDNGVFIGKDAGGADMTSGADNSILIGKDAGAGLTSGAGNVAIGYQSLDATTTGASNTMVGYQTGTALPAGGDGNTAVGYQALLSANNDTSHENTVVGYQAGQQISSGFNNTMIGANVDVSTGSFDNVTAIGNNFEATQDDTVFLGNASVDAVYAASDGDAVVYCGGINMSNNQAAPDAGTSTNETLDGYEEGTFGNTIKGTETDPSRGGGLIITDVSHYTKIGNRVFVQIHLITATSGITAGAGNLYIEGLPFTSTSTANAVGGATITYSTGWGTANTGSPSHGYVPVANNRIFFKTYDNDGGNIASITHTSAADVVHTGGGIDLMLTAVYMTDD